MYLAKIESPVFNLVRLSCDVNIVESTNNMKRKFI